jgi:hypothetical protein
LIQIALISALDLKRHPENIGERVGCLELKLRPNAEHLPLRLKFDIVEGSIMTLEEFRLDVAKESYRTLYGGYQATCADLRVKGSLGAVMLVVELENRSEIVIIAMPSAADMKRAPVVYGDWVRCYYLLVSLISQLTLAYDRFNG